VAVNFPMTLTFEHDLDKSQVEPGVSNI